MTDPYNIAYSSYQFDLPSDFNFGRDVIDARAQETPGRIAYIAVDRGTENIRHVTYADLSGASNRFANVLLHLGATKGDFALVIMERIPAWFETLIGCMKVGVVAMPGTTLLTARDIRYRINKTRARFVVVSSGHADKVEEIRADCPSLEHLIIVTNARNGWIHYESACVSQPAEIAPHQLQPTQADEMMLAYFTSGTTADPKLVPRDHSYAKAHEITGRFWLDLNDNDVHWTLSDTGWAKAAWGMLFGPWMAGAAIVLYDGDIRFDAVCHLKLIAKLRVSTFCAPPTVYRLFTQHDLTTYDLSSIRHSVSAGEPLNPEVIRVWKETTGTVVHDGYGQTETVNVVANFPFMPVRPGSMGKAAPGFTVSIVNDDGLPLSNNDIGHIAIKVTEPHPPGLFHGYYNGPNDLDRSSFRH
ncbi:MAG: AMP-binding protein, partial [Pseudomonadota bacterium]|nr:AMP-binding protein [Pseudomonadota bacterium]